MGNRLREFLSGITLALTLVTPRGATPFLEAISISPHTHALGGDLRKKM
jgi:hypothetical protein